jgi:hypothetical protein
MCLQGVEICATGEQILLILLDSLFWTLDDNDTVRNICRENNNGGLLKLGLCLNQQRCLHASVTIEFNI